MISMLSMSVAANHWYVRVKKGTLGEGYQTDLLARLPVVHPAAIHASRVPSNTVH